MKGGREHRPHHALLKSRVWGRTLLLCVMCDLFFLLKCNSSQHIFPPFLPSSNSDYYLFCSFFLIYNAYIVLSHSQIYNLTFLLKKNVTSVTIDVLVWYESVNNVHELCCRCFIPVAFLCLNLICLFQKDCFHKCSISSAHWGCDEMLMQKKIIVNQKLLYSFLSLVCFVFC